MALNSSDSTKTVITGSEVMGWINRSVGVLSERRDEINSLNVFPVPDSDTGSNMLATLTAARDAAAATAQTDAKSVVTSLAMGAVRGARGNSGTVLSQVLRALAESAERDGITAEAISDALLLAVAHVQEAISNPVEGTILSVLRVAAEKAQTLTSGSDHQPVGGVVKQIAAAAREALANTPSQLPQLREAGVVDAGGAGLVLLFDALVDEIEGSTEPNPELYLTVDDNGGNKSQATGLPTSLNSLESHDPAHPEMEVMYLLPLEPNEEAQLRERLELIGDSIIIAAAPEDRGVHMVHIHTFDPGAAIEAAFDFGTPQGIRIEVLVTARPAIAAEKRILIASVPEGPLVDLFTSAGALTVGTHENSDVVAETVDLIANHPTASEVLLLPNGLMTSDDLVRVEVFSGIGNRTLTTVQASSLVAGLAAVAVHDSERPLPIDAYAMSEAVAGIRRADLVRAQSSRLTGVGPCSKGDILTIVDNRVTAISDTVERGVGNAVRAFLANGGGELITLLLSDGADAHCAQALRQELAEKNIDAEVIAYSANGMSSLVQLGVE